MLKEQYGQRVQESRPGCVCEFQGMDVVGGGVASCSNEVSCHILRLDTHMKTQGWPTLPLLLVSKHGFWDGELMGQVGSSQVLCYAACHVNVVCVDRKEDPVTRGGGGGHGPSSDLNLMNSHTRHSFDYRLQVEPGRGMSKLIGFVPSGHQGAPHPISLIRMIRKMTKDNYPNQILLRGPEKIASALPAGRVKGFFRDRNFPVPKTVNQGSPVPVRKSQNPTVFTGFPGQTYLHRNQVINICFSWENCKMSQILPPQGQNWGTLQYIL